MDSFEAGGFAVKGLTDNAWRRKVSALLTRRTSQCTGYSGGAMRSGKGRGEGVQPEAGVHRRGRTSLYVCGSVLNTRCCWFRLAAAGPDVTFRQSVASSLMKVPVDDSSHLTPRPNGYRGLS